MHLSHLSLHDFRSWAELELPLLPGPTVLVGGNGQGKTNLVEAVGYAASLSSHRVSTDAPLVRLGAERAIVRAEVVREQRTTLVEIEINAGRANRARLNRAPVPRAREALGVLRTVLFAPEDLSLVKGDPSERRRFLDDLLVARQPRWAAVRADHDRVLRQRNALLRSAGAARRGGGLATLDVWDAHLARAGAELLAGRLELTGLLQPLVAAAYAAVSPGPAVARLDYRSSVATAPGADEDPGGGPEGPSTPVAREALAEALLAEMARRREEELDRGVSLVGPHRDDLLVSLGDFAARGYASHGESWSLALALRLGSFDLLRADGGEPVLVLDDVFAELDTSRRDRLAALVAPAEQVLVTAAVPDDVPTALQVHQIAVSGGHVSAQAGSLSHA